MCGIKLLVQIVYSRSTYGEKQVTLRDETWNTVLERLSHTGRFRLTDLPFKPEERATVRRVLREAEEYGWLCRTSEGSSIWRAGPKAEMLMNLGEEQLRLAHE